MVITNQYDLGNRLLCCGSVNGAYQTFYAYSPTGLRTSMVDASGVTAYLYDAMSRLTNKLVAWANGPTNGLSYAYSTNGSLTALWSSSANGVTNACQYDLQGRLTNVAANGSAVAGYGFDVVGNLQSLAYANGVTNLYRYDSMNRLTNLVWKAGSTSLASFAYTLGPTGNRTALAESVNGMNRSYNWVYDYLYRLTGETLSGGTVGAVTYGYDPVGNRTNRTSTVTGVNPQNNTFTANDWLGSDKYDSNGNTTNSSAIAYQYDALNHLTNANNGAILIGYDGDGNRVKKTVSGTGTTTYYLLDDRNPSGYVQVLEEWTAVSSTTNLSKVYNYGLSLISQRQALSGTVSYYGCDGHGSTRFLANTSGTITDTYTYDSYGLLIASTGLTPNIYLYCRQQWDSDLGFYYNRARYLNPGTGRFFTMDTDEGNNEDPLSLHKYLYCQGNPINGIDPTGHFDFSLGSFSLSMAIGGTLDALGAQTLSRAFAMAVFQTVTVAVAVDVAVQQKRDWKGTVFRYDPVPGKSFFPTGTYVTDNPYLTWSQAVSITFFENMQYLYVYQLSVRPADLGPELKPVMGHRQWQLDNTVYNVKIIRTMSKQGGGSNVF